MELSQEKEWEINDLQNRYKATYDFEVDTKQAEQILKYEQEKSSGSYKYFFSDWEALDFEQTTFQDILTTAQFKKYLSERPIIEKQIEKSLIEQDQQYVPQLKAAEERLIYYKKTLIPKLRKESIMLSGIFSFESDKVNFLKAAYKSYLTDAKKQSLTQHFRVSRTFQPTMLKLHLLLHEEKCWLPNYISFKATMDIATKTVANYIEEKISSIPENQLNSIKETIESLKEFNVKNTAKHLGESRGWHISIRSNEKESLMFMILLHPEMYIN